LKKPKFADALLFLQDLQYNDPKNREEFLKVDIKGGYRKPGTVQEEGAFLKKGLISPRASRECNQGFSMRMKRPCAFRFSTWPQECLIPKRNPNFFADSKEVLR